MQLPFIVGIIIIGLVISSNPYLADSAGGTQQVPQEQLKSLPSTQHVTVDGKWTTLEEWTDAAETRTSKTGYVLVKDDASFVYVLIEFTADHSIDDRDFARLRLDTKNDKALTPQYDDLILLANWVSGKLVSGTVRGNGVRWNLVEGYTDVRIASSNDSSYDPYSAESHLIYEFEVPRSLMEGSEIGISVTAGHEMGTSEAVFMNLPRRQNPLSPSTWATLQLATASAASATTSVATHTSSENRGWSRGWPFIAAIGMGVLLVGVLGAYYVRKRRGK